MEKQFTTEELDRIKAAVSGEIVPVVVQRSGFYSIANYRGALGMAVITFLTIVMVDRYSVNWAILDPLLIFLMVILGGVFGAFVTHFSPTIKRQLLSQVHIDQATA
jgi:putative membrane protein